MVFGGLGRRDVPLGDAIILRPSEKGFLWEAIDVHPPVVPRCVGFHGSNSFLQVLTGSQNCTNLFFFLFLRYSHCAHVIGEMLVVVGGVWHHSAGVPGGVMINLTTRSSMEFTMDTVIFAFLPSVHLSTCSFTFHQELFCYFNVGLSKLTR